MIAFDTKPRISTTRDHAMLAGVYPHRITQTGPRHWSRRRTSSGMTSWITRGVTTQDTARVIVELPEGHGVDATWEVALMAIGGGAVTAAIEHVTADEAHVTLSSGVAHVIREYSRFAGQRPFTWAGLRVILRPPVVR